MLFVDLYYKFYVFFYYKFIKHNQGKLLVL